MPGNSSQASVSYFLPRLIMYRPTNVMVGKETCFLTPELTLLLIGSRSDAPQQKKSYRDSFAEAEPSLIHSVQTVLTGMVSCQIVWTSPTGSSSNQGFSSIKCQV